MTTVTAIEEVTTDLPLEDVSIDELEAMMDSMTDDVSDDMPDEVVEEVIEDVTPAVEVVDEISDEELEALIADDDEPAPETVELSEEDLAEVVSSAEAADEKMAAYEAQESEEADTVAPVKADDKATKPKAKREPRKTTYNSTRHEVADDRASSDFYLLENADLELDEDGKKAKHEEVSETINKLNVKVGASCINFLSALNGKAKLSQFTEIAIRFIAAPEAEPIRRIDLQNHFMDAEANGFKAYKKGTATPKATNSLKMLLELKVIVQSSEGYMINEESVLFPLAKTVLAIA